MLTPFGTTFTFKYDEAFQNSWSPNWGIGNTKMNKRIVTRFAPSPTGSLHVGGLRTALYNKLYAEINGGTFILRIEDTDKARSTDESLKGIIRDLQWAGLDWHEGPSSNQNDLRNNQVGDNGPYFQSQRLDIYNDYIEQLLRNDMAYHKDGAVAFKMPKEDVIINDMVLGEVKYGKDQCQDMIIRKTDGMPTYHFAVVVDDETMGVTDIIRGQEHLQNTWKHILIQKALGFRTPNYAHIPLILNTDGSKMSKRQKTGQVNTDDFRKDGFTAPALLNYLALLGWSPGGDREEMTYDEMQKCFKLDGIGKANARFDYKKLSAFNANFIQKMPLNKFCDDVYSLAITGHQDFMNDLYKTHIKWEDLCELYKSRSKSLIDPITTGKSVVNPVMDDAAVEKVLLKNNGVDMLQWIKDKFSLLPGWTKDNINNAINELANEHQVKAGLVSQPIRVAITGTAVSPPIDETLLVLGRDETTKRIQNCISYVEYGPIGKVQKTGAVSV